jgi:hypothetical protein
VSSSGQESQGRVPRRSETTSLFPRPAGVVVVRQIAARHTHPGGTDLDDLRICAASMGEFDHPENPATEHDD